MRCEEAWVHRHRSPHGVGLDPGAGPHHCTHQLRQGHGGRQRRYRYTYPTAKPNMFSRKFNITIMLSCSSTWYSAATSYPCGPTGLLKKDTNRSIGDLMSFEVICHFCSFGRFPTSVTRSIIAPGSISFGV